MKPAARTGTGRSPVSPAQGPAQVAAAPALPGTDSPGGGAPAAGLQAGRSIQLQLDGRPYTLPAPGTLATLVAGLGHAPEAVGTAVNGAYVARGARADRTLHDGDAVLFFQPIVGG